MQVLAEVLKKLADQQKIVLNSQPVKHPGLIGQMYEGLTKDVLKQIDFSHPDIKVASGVITSGGEESGEIDCMVVIGDGEPIPHTNNFYYPIEQVIAVFEVKKNLYSKELNHAYDHLNNFFQLSKQDYTRRQAQGNLEFKTTRPAMEFMILFGEWPPHFDDIASLPFHKAAVYQSLVRDWLTPLRITIGYNGFKSEDALRKGVGTLFDGKENVRGYGVADMPNLMISNNGHSIIKLNGMPYQGNWNDDIGWGWLASSNANPYLLILELLLDRVELLLNTKPDRGHDQDLEEHISLMYSWPEKQPGAANGWRHTFLTEKIPKREPGQRKWMPLTLSNTEKEFIRLIHQEGPQFIGSTKLTAFMDKHSVEDIHESTQVLRKARVILEANNIFSICSGDWRVAKVRGVFYCGDNAGSRFEHWLGLNTVPMRWPLKTVKISRSEIGPTLPWPVVS